jgi:hypothetical protein
MDLKDIESQWTQLKIQESELEKQLRENREAQSMFLRKAGSQGFYWSEGCWKK